MSPPGTRLFEPLLLPPGSVLAGSWKQARELGINPSVPTWDAYKTSILTNRPNSHPWISKYFCSKTTLSFNYISGVLCGFHTLSPLGWLSAFNIFSRALTCGKVVVYLSLPWGSPCYWGLFFSCRSLLYYLPNPFLIVSFLHSHILLSWWGCSCQGWPFERMFFGIDPNTSPSWLTKSLCHL